MRSCGTLPSRPLAQSDRRHCPRSRNSQKIGMSRCGLPPRGAWQRRTARAPDHYATGQGQGCRRAFCGAVALGVMGPAAKDAIPTLAELGRDPRVCGDAALALSRVGPAAIPALTELLKEQNDRVRADAAWALGMIGPAAREAIPTLAGMLKHGGNDAPTAAKAPAR